MSENLYKKFGNKPHLWKKDVYAYWYDSRKNLFIMKKGDILIFKRNIVDKFIDKETGNTYQVSKHEGLVNRLRLWLPYPDEMFARKLLIGAMEAKRALVINELNKLDLMISDVAKNTSTIIDK